MPGVDLLGTAMLLVEIGADMDAFGSADRLASWVASAPATTSRPGKHKSGRVRKGNPYVRRLLCEFAHAASVGLSMGWNETQLLPRGLPGEQGPGNALLLTLEYENVTEVFSGFGEKMVRAETVAKNTVQEARQYMSSGAAVGEHLADQIMLPFALAGAGRFTAHRASQHAVTNAAMIERFLPVAIRFEDMGGHMLCALTAR